MRLYAYEVANWKVSLTEEKTTSNFFLSILGVRSFLSSCITERRRWQHTKPKVPEVKTHVSFLSQVCCGFTSCRHVYRYGVMSILPELKVFSRGCVPFEEQCGTDDGFASNSTVIFVLFSLLKAAQAFTL